MPRHLQGPPGQCPEVQVAHLRTQVGSHESKVALMEGTSGHLGWGVHSFSKLAVLSDWLMGAHRGLLIAHSIHRDSGEHRSLKVMGCFLSLCHTLGPPTSLGGLGVTPARRLRKPPAHHTMACGVRLSWAAAVQRMSRSELPLPKEAGA